MNQAVIKNQSRPVSSDEILKTTALLYFKEALVKEEYENCAELIANAKIFGANQGEIGDVIAGFIGKIKVGGQNEAFKRRGN